MSIMSFLERKGGLYWAIINLIFSFKNWNSSKYKEYKSCSQVGKFDFSTHS